MNNARTLRLSGEGDHLEFVFPFEWALDDYHKPNALTSRIIEGIKGLKPRFRYDGRRQCWRSSLTVAALRAAALWIRENDEIGFVVEPEVKATAERLVSQSRVNLERSRALTAAAVDFAWMSLGLELKPYQRAGVVYAVNARRCLIADEMGLGKTAQALATLKALEIARAVVVTPASVKYNWEREAMRWLPGCKVQVVDDKDWEHGTNGTHETYGTNGAEPSGPGHQGLSLVVVNYDIVRKHLDALRAFKPQAIVLDEAHYLKNKESKRYQAVHDLMRGVDVRLALTGTPVDNRPKDLKPLLQLLGKLEEFGGSEEFSRRYLSAQRVTMRGRTFWKPGDGSNLNELQSKLRSFCMVRRLKRDVLPELPEKRRVRVDVSLDPQSAQEYRRAQADVLSWIREKEGEKARGEGELWEVIRERAKAAAAKAATCEELVKLTALRQIAARGKVDAVQEWLTSFQESGEKLVLFGVHKGPLKAISEQWGVEPLTGDTPALERQAMVDRFAEGLGRKLVDGKNPTPNSQPQPWLFSAQLQAGGTGIDGLQHASTNVAFLEQAWKPSVMEQAESRLHRIGQKSAVTSWVFVARGTVDEWLWELNEEKGQEAREAQGDRI